MASATPGRGAASSRKATANSPSSHEHLARLLIVLASAVEADASANSQLSCPLLSGAGSERAPNSGTAYAHRAEAGAAHDASDCGDGLEARAFPAPANSREPAFSGEGACLERATSWADHVRDGSTRCDPASRIAATAARANSTARGAPTAELGGGAQPAPIEPAARSSARPSLSGEPNLWDTLANIIQGVCSAFGAAYDVQRDGSLSVSPPCPPAASAATRAATHANVGLGGPDAMVLHGVGLELMELGRRLTPLAPWSGSMASRPVTGAVSVGSGAALRLRGGGRRGEFTAPLLRATVVSAAGAS